FWHRPTDPLVAFEAASRSHTFGPGVGLPGRVWASGQATWIADVTRDTNFPRAPFADRDGLRGAFGFPIVQGNQTLGVLEFFSRQVQPRDDDLLRLLTAIGSQIGLFVERWRAAEALREADRRKNEFLAMLAHELRNPLAPLRNGLSILKMPQA